MLFLWDVCGIVPAENRLPEMAAGIGRGNALGFVRLDWLNQSTESKVWFKNILNVNKEYE
jgi:hypothetical protein